MEDLPKTKEEIFPKLQDFSYYFLKKIEEQFKTSLDVLEGADVRAGNFLARLAVIPVLDTAVALSNLVYFLRSNKDETRKILIKAAYEIFTCYEMQFVQATCKGGPVKAIQKLGYYAAQKFLNYCAANNVRAFDEALVIKSIICETNFLNNLVGIAKFGGTVEDACENSWKIAKIYTKVGVFDKASATCYKLKCANTRKYGHRLKFSYETVSDDWEKDELTYDYEQLTDLNDFEADYPIILEYAMKKDPEECAKFDRENKHQQTLQAISNSRNTLLEFTEVTHQETRSSIVNFHEDLKDGSRKQHEVVTQMLEEIKVAQEIIIHELPVPPYTVGHNSKGENPNVQQTNQWQQEEKIERRNYRKIAKNFFEKIGFRRKARTGRREEGSE